MTLRARVVRSFAVSARTAERRARTGGASVVGGPQTTYEKGQGTVKKATKPTVVALALFFVSIWVVMTGLPKRDSNNRRMSANPV